MADGYERFIADMKQLTGIDLSLYKEEQMRRRLTALKNKYQAADFHEYFTLLKQDARLLDECLDRMTINVSSFFRNRKRWTYLEEHILPKLIEKRKGKLKIWSAACSTGEEPYTLAIILSKFLPLTDFTILATDIDAKVLEKAQTGLYDERAFQECTKDEIKTHFTQEGKLYRITPRLKQPIRFKKHNLLSDPYERGFDLIVCRNVLIYFTDQAKEKIYASFSESIKPGGFLFVGSTEQIFHPHTFHLQSSATFFYQRMKEEVALKN